MKRCIPLIVIILGFLWPRVGVAQNALASGQYQSHYDQALDLYQKEQYGHAQRFFDEILADEQSWDRETRASAAYYGALCALKLYHGDADARVEAFAEEFYLSPLINRLYFEFANFRFSVKRYRQAAEYYEKTDHYRLPKENLPEYYFKKAYAHLSLEQEEEARPLFAELRKGDSRYANPSKYYYAHLLYNDSNYNAALKEFLPLQDSETFGPLIPYYLAQIYYRLEDYDQLLAVGEELIENATPSRAPEIAKLMGDAFYNKGEYQAAVNYLEIYREKGGRMRQQDHFELGYALYQTGRTREAINSFNKITGNNGPEALRQNAWYHLADCYLQTGEKQKAMTAFKAAAELRASEKIREDAYLNYAKMAYETSDPFEDAITTLNRFLDEFPRSTHHREVNEYLANLYVTTKNYERALEAMERTGLESVAMQAAYQKVAFFRGSELYTAGQYGAARQKWEEALRYNRDASFSALTHYWLGQTHLELENYTEALEAFSRFRQSAGAVRMDEFARSFYHSGYAHYHRGDYQQAATELRKFVREPGVEKSFKADAYLRLGDSYLLTGGYEVARDFYRKALGLDIAAKDYTRFMLAQCQGLAGNREAKINTLEDLLRAQPQSVYAERAQYEIAISLLQLEEYDRAIRALDAFIDEYPQSRRIAAARMQKGLAYSNSDRNDEALNTFRLVVTQHPGSAEALEAVGLARLVYVRQNRVEDYLDWVDGLDFVNFSRAALDSTAYNSVFEQYSSGRCQGAVSAGQSYLERFPEGLFALKVQYFLADCGRELDREDLTRQSYEAILERRKNEYTVEALRYLAQAAQEEEDHVKAVKLYQRYVEVAERQSDAERAHEGLAHSHIALGNHREALDNAEWLLARHSGHNAARHIAARSLAGLGEWERALQYLDPLIAESGGDLRAEAFYLKAEVLHRQKKYEASNEVVFKLIEELPGYKEWKMKALMLSANNYWRQDDIFQANYTLDFVISSAYSAEVTQEAQAMKDRIAEDELRKASERQRSLQQEADSLQFNGPGGVQRIRPYEPQDTTSQKP